MNEVLVEKWNAKIKKNDRVYHLGDFCFGGKGKILDIFHRLNGQKHLVRGNHDVDAKWFDELWASVQDYKSIRIEGQKIVMMHYPLLTWDKAHNGSWMLHGHSHHLLQPSTQPRIDVGVDGEGYDFSPLSYEEVVALMEGRSYTPVDHHVPDGYEEPRSYVVGSSLGGASATFGGRW